MIRFWLYFLDPVTGDADEGHPLHDEAVVMPIVPRVGESVIVPSGLAGEREYLVKQVTHRFLLPHRVDGPNDRRREEPFVTVILERRS